MGQGKVFQAGEQRVCGALRPETGGMEAVFTNLDMQMRKSCPCGQEKGQWRRGDGVVSFTNAAANGDAQTFRSRRWG